MLALYWSTALALLAFAYCLTTLFSKARVAGTASALIYLAAMIPGWVGPFSKFLRGCIKFCSGWGGVGWVGGSCLV